MRELTCVRCPLGCAIFVETRGKEVTSITGNSCRQGEQYAVKEITNPARTVTTTVRLEDRTDLVLPVKTEKDIPKRDILNCIAALKKVSVRTPVHMGQVILRDVAGTGVSVIATKDIWYNEKPGRLYR